MNKALILLGSNEGDRRGFLQNAAQELQCSAGTIQKASLIYESAAWGFTSDTDFLNQALLLDTALQPLPLLQITQAIETHLGRVRKSTEGGYASRCIDIDIMLYGNQIVRASHLEIPHPRWQLRRFALLPMTDIVPEWVHPVFKKTVQELLWECTDRDGATAE
jgi:2-amino-4-hydroxy-6-hydroxymethyldihydropteridine diphosphokinase